MNICVLQPSYEGSTFDYQHYDLPRDLSSLLPEHTVHHAFLKKVSTFRQLRDLKKQGFDIYVNLCEGYLDSDIPSIDVIMALEHLNLPYTGPTLTLYDPPKDLMKFGRAGAGRVRTDLCRRGDHRGSCRGWAAATVSAIREAQHRWRQPGH